MGAYRFHNVLSDGRTSGLEEYGAPRDLVLFIENPTLEISGEVMKQCDTVIATGGGGMVKAAYSSGTPAYGVGVGNALVIVDEKVAPRDEIARTCRPLLVTMMARLYG